MCDRCSYCSSRERLIACPLEVKAAAAGGPQDVFAEAACHISSGEDVSSFVP